MLRVSRIFPALFAALSVVACEVGDNKGTLDLCPDTASGENGSDCPWAAIGRSMALRASNGAPLRPAVEGAAPELLDDWSNDKAAPDVLTRWGDAVNFDESVNATIVVPEIVDFVNDAVGAPKRQNNVTHAGVQHTYGYLFSVLKTPFGYKRTRWTQHEIEVGLGLPDGSLSPLPQGGSLLRNASFFGGRIALGDDDAAKQVLVAIQTTVSPALVGFGFRDLKVTRVRETIPVDASRTVDLRTDLIAFGARRRWAARP